MYSIPLMTKSVCISLRVIKVTIVIALVATVHVVSNIYNISILKELTEEDVNAIMLINHNNFLTPNNNSTLVHHQPTKRRSARDIVNTAYKKSFDKLQKSCPNDWPLFKCMKHLETITATTPTATLTDKEQEDNSSQNNDLPWWFQTMLRDGGGWPKKPLHGFWHHLDVANPPLHMCVIEKIGTKSFRKLQCTLNDGMDKYPQPCNPPTEEQISPNAPKTVFLRDPLERFLSGFLDKCIHHTSTSLSPELAAQAMEHCGPFAANMMMQQQDSSTSTAALPISNNNKAFFEAFVDTLPLQWNAHFFPQSLYCDGLYRKIEEYDFVGHMDGSNFYNDLESFRHKYANNETNNLKQTMNDVFDLDNQLSRQQQQRELLLQKQQQQRNIGVGVENSSGSKVEEYYSPKTVKRVLEYMSIDYVTLDLPIPSWAEKMLLLANDDI